MFKFPDASAAEHFMGRICPRCSVIGQPVAVSSTTNQVHQQLTFVDTPRLFAPRKRRRQSMSTARSLALNEAIICS